VDSYLYHLLGQEAVVIWLAIPSFRTGTYSNKEPLELPNKHDPESKADVYPYDLAADNPYKVAGTAIGYSPGRGQTMTRSMCGETVSLISHCWSSWRGRNNANRDLKSRERILLYASEQI
jgi:hypothetical protein